MTLLKIDKYGTEYSFETIFNALDENLSNCVSASNNCHNEYAKSDLRYGAARRLKIIKNGYITINDICTQGRTKPLTEEEQDNVSLHLNSIYFHLMGLLDNVAWGIVNEFDIFENFDETNIKDKHKVGLFKLKFSNIIKSRYANLHTTIETKRDWHQDLKELRDPLAHRIPLYAVPSMLNETEAKEYGILFTNFRLLLEQHKPDEASSLMDKIENLGTYRPYFHNRENAKEKLYHIHTQIEYDLDNCLEIVNAALNIFSP